MVLYQPLRVHRDLLREKDSRGKTIETVDVSFTPIFSPILAESAQEALSIANAKYFTFKGFLAMEPWKYAKHVLRSEPESQPTTFSAPGPFGPNPTGAVQPARQPVRTNRFLGRR